MSRRAFALVTFPIVIGFVACSVYAAMTSQWWALAPASLGLLVIAIGRRI